MVNHMNFFKNLITDRDIVKRLSLNDFKAKFSGSYFGIFWAFMQPIVTIMIYVFVFQVGFRAQPTDNGYPYVLWLIAGIVPWFFFSEALTTATSSLIEYNYLVKKVVFRIDVLPIVKVVSAFFVHAFFVAFAVVIFLLNGKWIPLQFVQIFYYMIACIFLIVSISYITASIVPFFRDFQQIVNIVLQLGMWLCPIMWNESLLITSESRFISTVLVKILRFNPMYYIVQGYRCCFMGGEDSWFWERPLLTVYFWIFVILAFILGQQIYRKLKVHFADVL